ncbi:hypothetical protein H6G33_24200 [Calothrix sp. FACHB-1219]|nr:MULTISPECIES: hypothetical protein [unclassified Calothrix]MBD2205447.1 hypothetical protein [Calothrix sp. FACHB-168]MBD2220109.1 hypothetical protein [Calothrix sp. FACHB-1219]
MAHQVFLYWQAIAHSIVGIEINKAGLNSLDLSYAKISYAFSLLSNLTLG